MGNLGERIKGLRAEKGLTQKSLAADLSVTVSTLSHWECNYQEPSSKDILRLAAYFQVSTDYLLGRSDDIGTDIPLHFEFSRKEQQLIRCFRELPESSQNLILGMVQSAVDAQKRA